ncbi:purine-nucleoside phosphorylase, partial [Staphylococcus pseudintermedius]|uniref:phosphorylase family protein n=1 Tax=Staphylococcus pseudintermedius TaxID=283734 RepID=UPI000E39D94C
FEVVVKAKEKEDANGARAHVGNMLTSDTFYNAKTEFNQKWIEMGILGVEIESAGLYLKATKTGKKALGIFTVNDHLLRDEATTVEERQKSFTQMMEVALEIAV